MDTGIGHDIETELQAYGYPVLWGQYLPLDADILDWLFGADIKAGAIRSPLDISDVWRSSYSANTNEILWAAKFAARMPWIACVLRLSSYECGMDQPTYTPVQAIIESSGTLFFSFQDLDSTKPAGAVKIRIETIAYYLAQYASAIVARKQPRLPIQSPMAVRPAA
jgi:predicted nucleotide-binding protein (sugar kinase/HSP70/actin superfamily)